MFPEIRFVGPSQIGLALSYTGDYFSLRSVHAAARAAFQEAVVAHDRALDFAPDDPGFHTNRGIALASLGSLEAGLGNHAAARAALLESLEAFKRVLEIFPSDSRLATIVQRFEEVLQRDDTEKSPE